MKQGMNAESVFNMFKELSVSERAALAEQILKMMAEPQPDHREKRVAAKDLCKELGARGGDGKPDCPHCGAKANLGYIIKRGMNKGAQRYYCKACGKYFVPTTNTAFAFTRKDAETWKKFICMTVSGKSLQECEDACQIAHLTAFTWRHKILNVFLVAQESTRMAGNVEVDEMLIPISYKGNHVKGKFGRRTRAHGEDNGLPRNSYHRGTDNISRSAKDKACVFCMVENGNKAFYAGVPGVGFMSETMLNATVAKHVNKGSAMMIADNYKITRKYFEDNGYNHTILTSNTSDNPKEHKPEIRDGLHLQHVNSMHHHIRNFLKPYYGVSSKYLSNYISLFVWLKSVQQMRQRNAADKVSVVRAATPDCYVSRKQLESRPAVPMCA